MFYVVAKKTSKTQANNSQGNLLYAVSIVMGPFAAWHAATGGQYQDRPSKTCFGEAHKGPSEMCPTVPKVKAILGRANLYVSLAVSKTDSYLDA